MSACFWWKIRKKKKENQSEDGLDSPAPSISSLPVSNSLPDIDIGSVDLTSNAPKLSHQTKNRARRTKNVRPTTRQSEMPRKQSTDSLKVDENVDNFFSKPSSPLVAVTEKKEETPTKTPRGGLLSKFHGSPKSSPSPKKSRISDVQEEPDEVSLNNSKVLTRSTTENTSLRGSMDKKSEKLSNSASETSSLSGSLGRKSNKSDSVSKKSEDSESLKSDTSGSSDRRSDKSRDRSPVNLSENELEETAAKQVANDKGGTNSESDTDKPPEKEADENNSAVKNEDVKKEEKKPLHPPSTKRSFNKADSQKETSSVSEEPVEEKTEEKTEENKESVKDNKEAKETEEKDAEKKEEEKDVKEDTKDTEGENDKGTTEEVEEKKPLKKPGMPGAMGFGVNIMADLKAKQEKRKSMMPAAKPSARAPSDQPEKQASAAEEKKPPFGLHKLKPVSKPVPKESKESESNQNSVPVKPADNKTSEPVKVPEKSVQKNKTGSVDTDVKNEIKTDDKPKKNIFAKEASAEKPAVIPRPSGLNKPPPPMRPKPPPPSSKPTPAPRKSLSTAESTEQDEEISKPEKKAADSGVVYDSATLKMSVKDKISKFRSSGNESEATKGKPLLQSEKKESEDNNNLPASKTESPDAGELDVKKVGNSEMTDSGIVADSPRTSVKDALSKLDGKEVGTRKHGSLPRNLSAEDVEKEAQESSKRPKSMFAVVGSRPDLKKSLDDKLDIPEENDKDLDTENAILV